MGRLDAEAELDGDGGLRAASPEVFAQRRGSATEFWRRFGTIPDLAGRSVLDIGCGQGVMALRLAEAGAGRVVGVDLDPVAVARAGSNTRRFHPELAGRVEFRACDVADLPADEAFDVAVSKDTFEHVADVPALLDRIHRVLRPGGRLYAGFSPLWFSPFGDHARTGIGVPWGHAVLPRAVVLRAAARLRGEAVADLLDIGLNGLTPAAFRAAFDTSPFEVESLVYNRGGRRLMPLLNVLRRFPGLERFGTVSIYAVLRRSAVHIPEQR